MLKSLRLAIFIVVLMFGGSRVFAQVTSPVADAIKPVAGARHDYIHLLNETDNPQTGGMSLRINLPTASDRDLTVPFAVSYDTTSAHHGALWLDNASYLGVSGWSYLMPTLTFSFGNVVGPSAAGEGSGTNNGQVGPQIACDYFTGFMFEDSSGTMHSLGLNALDTTNSDCQYVNYWMYPYTSGGDVSVSAVTAGLTYNFDNVHPVTVSDSDGTVYYFSNTHLHATPADSSNLYEVMPAMSTKTTLPDSITDRNGNQMTFVDQGSGAFSVLDSMGRTAISTNGFAASGSTVTVSGLGAYTITWAPQSYSATYNVQEIPPAGDTVGSASVTPIYCYGPTGEYTTPQTVSYTAKNIAPVITAITLPNGQQYQFQYDSVTGLISRLTYPDGAYSRYVWTINPMAVSEVYGATNGNNSAPASTCQTIHDVPALSQKFTSFDGKTEVLEEVYTYAQTAWVPSQSGSVNQKWTSKQTTVTTMDLQAGTSYKTVYNYVPVAVDPTGVTLTPQQKAIGLAPVNPAESSILYYDTNGALLKVVDKSYMDFWSKPLDEKTTLDNGQTTEVQSCYQGTQGWASWCSNVAGSLIGGGNILTDQWTYDYGTATGAASNPGASGALLHHVHADYNTFATPLYPTAATIVDRPSDVITYDGSGNEVARTDYCYDGQTSASGCVSNGGIQAASAVQHNEANFSPSYVVGRGNVTTKIARCFVGSSSTACAQGDSIVQYQWDETGQMVQKTDANGNVTKYSYADNFDSNPSSQTNGYLTLITNAKNQTESFKYAYSDGQLILDTDENSQQANYYYWDSLRRLTSTTYPDGGADNLAYNESTYPPNVVTNKKLDTTRYVTSTAVLDGTTSHTTEAQLNSDSTGVDKSDTTFDGHGRSWVVTNPYRSTSDTTFSASNVQTTQYDGLGRVKSLTRQDGSVVTTTYSGNTTTVTDEAGNQRRSVADALGRLLEVDEPGDNYPATPATGTLTVTGSLRSVSGVGSYPATYSTASVTIGGTEESKTVGGQGVTEWDAGTVSITINGNAVSVSYGQSSSAYSIASALVAAINANSYDSTNVVATQSNDVVNLQEKTAGAITISLSAAVSSTQSGLFSPPSFSASASGAITGGENAYAGTTAYDYGTASVTIGSWTSPTVPYGQSGNNAGNNTNSSVAAALAGVLNGSGSPVTAQVVNGDGLALVCKTLGTACNGESVTIASTTSDTQYFSGGGSFGGAATMLGGGGNLQSSSLAIPFVTLYKYDALGNLLCAEQHGDAASGTGCSSYPTPTTGDSYRPRMFKYNSLGQLLNAYNPETGTISYTYDANGNTVTKTDARGVVITYGYDSLNRVTGETFSSGDPAVTYSYDQGSTGTYPIGRRTGMTDASGSTAWTYDPMGRILSESRTINPGAGLNPVTETLSYLYDLAGNITQITYPDGTIINYATDNAGRELSATDTTHSIHYIANATYAPNNSIAGFTTQAGNTITSTFLYNPRLQICRELASTTGTVPNACTDASDLGNVMDFQYDFHVGNGDNGNLFTAANNKDATRTQTYTYDTMNRLLTAQTAGTNCSVMASGTQTKFWGESFSYDAWANLTAKNTTLCSAENAVLSVNTRNQLLADGYDAAGNVTSSGGVSFNYNGESELASTSNGYSYIYDGDGNRVEKTNGSTGTLYWYGAPGIVLETDLLGNPQSEYVFFSGSRVARRDVSSIGSPIYYYFANQIHSTALITDENGNLEVDADYYPWGGTLEFTSNISNHYWFTGKERDPETGLDYFGARYYGNSMGRFLTPDWSAKVEGIPYADYTDPQSLNLYGYVRDNPLVKVDPDGHEGMSIAIALTGSTTVDTVVSFMMKAGPPGLAGAAVVAAASATIIGTAHAYQQNQQDKITMASVSSANAGILNSQKTSSANKKQDAATDKKATGTTKGTTLKPGPYAGNGVPARGPQRDFTEGERSEVNKQGQENGCHTCGSKEAGTKTGNFIPDHQPPNALSPPGAEQTLYPHCLDCSRKQGGDVNKAKQQQNQ